MKKISIAVLSSVLTIVISLSVNAKTLEFGIGNNNLYISEDKTISKETVETAPYTVNDTTLVPVRIISEKFGAEVVWNEADKKITINKESSVIELTLGSKTAIVDGKEISLITAPEEKNGRTMVPVRFISEALGYNVEYNEEMELVTITDSAPIFTGEHFSLTINDYLTMCKLYNAYDENFIAELNKYFNNILVCAEEALKENKTIDKDYLNKLVEEFKTNSEIYYSKDLISSELKLTKISYLASLYQNDFQPSKISEEEINKEYSEKYIQAKHILISTIDQTTNEPLSDEDTKKAKEQAESVLNQLKKGASFDKLMEKYSEDPGSKYYPQGYTFTKGEMVPEFEKAAYGLKIGSYSGLIKSSYGYHIIKREKLPELTEEMKNNIIAKKTASEFQSKIESLSGLYQLKPALSDSEISELLNER